MKGGGGTEGNVCSDMGGHEIRKKEVRVRAGVALFLY